jgi:hypothetical protein
VIVRRIVAKYFRRQRVVLVDDEGCVEHAHAGARSFGALRSEPLAALIHQLPDGVATTVERFEHDDVAELLVPVTLVALVDDRKTACDDRSVLARGEGPHPPLGVERALTEKDR